MRITLRLTGQESSIYASCDAPKPVQELRLPSNKQENNQEFNETRTCGLDNETSKETVTKMELIFIKKTVTALDSHVIPNLEDYSFGIFVPINSFGPVIVLKIWKSILL